MELSTRYWAPVVLLLGALAFSPTAVATAVFSGMISADNKCDQYPYDVVASDAACYRGALKIQAAGGIPISGRDCVANGLGINDGTLGAPQPTVASVNPPFSGSASASGYLVICNTENNDFAVWQLGVNLSGCALWVCDTTYWYREVRSASEMRYTLNQVTALVSRLDVKFVNASGQVCYWRTDCPISGTIY